MAEKDNKGKAVDEKDINWPRRTLTFFTLPSN